MYLAEEAFTKQGVRDKTKIIYGNATGAMFGVPAYNLPLEKVVERKNIEVKYAHNLIEIKADSKEAVFAIGEGETITIKYDMIHVSPPMTTYDFIKTSPLANGQGWVDVDKYTCQHTKYSNVFGLGDSSNLPTSKTAAAVRKEAPVVIENILALMNKKILSTNIMATPVVL